MEQSRLNKYPTEAIRILPGGIEYELYIYLNFNTLAYQGLTYKEDDIIVIELDYNI